MKKTLFALICLAAMLSAGMSLKAQEITITLSPGWNWISYPNAEVMSVATALGDFTPVQGDMIKSQGNGQTVYSNGRWFGRLSYLNPGRGYMYYSSRTESVEFVFAKPSSNVVETAMPTDITPTSAVVGGTVTVPEGSHVFLCGVCWGTEPDPNIDGDHTSDGTGLDSFSSTLEGLSPNTTYYVRAYAVSDNGLAYGNELSFTTLEEGSDDHDYVDLGLPSGMLWATCNVGANSPEEYGDYFAWGETQPKVLYDWSTYQYCNGSGSTLTKYCDNFSYGYEGFTDNLTTLLPEDDAATANWGSDWRTPTYEEWEELLNNTTSTWTTQNGVSGRLFTASNGNSIFLPAASYYDGSSLIDAGIHGRYWSSILNAGNPYGAWNYGFGPDGYSMYGYDRYCGQSVRPVRTPQIEHAYVDLDLPSGLLWATCNVGAETPEEYGDYFAWGETQPKDTYNWSTYQYCYGSYNTLTKYCHNPSNGYNGFTDNMITLLPEDDAATANWGSDWRMPTKEEWQELYQNTTHIWTTQNGVYGRLFTASNGNSLFLPFAGYRYDNSLYDAGDFGLYWSSSLYIDDPDGAWGFYFYSDNYGLYYSGRDNGLTVRPVCSSH